MSPDAGMDFDRRKKRLGFVLGLFVLVNFIVVCVVLTWRL